MDNELEKINQLILDDKFDEAIELIKSLYPNINKENQIRSKIIKDFGYLMLFQCEMPEYVKNIVNSWDDSSEEVAEKLVEADNFETVLYKIATYDDEKSRWELAEIFYIDYSNHYSNTDIMPYEVSELCSHFAEKIYLICPERAKIFYQMSCWFIETYYDLLWIINNIIIKYQSIDAKFISDCGKGDCLKRNPNKDGWNMEPEDWEADGPVIGNDPNYEIGGWAIEDYEDLAYDDIDINEFEKVSDLLFEIQKKMKDYK